MALTKTRRIGKIINANKKYLAFDSDQIHNSFSKGSTGGSGTMDVFTSIDSLPSSAAAGTKALVTSTNTLYIYSGGWYKIAIINAFNPQWITEPNGSYSLAIDGSTTTITVLATDSDDVPITYTAVADSGFNAIATIAHDSDKHNVWTVTPTASSSGSGTITFKASDGVNLVQAVSSFDISFVVSNSNYTTTLVYADSDSNDNQVDATSNHTLTQTSNFISSSFSPYHPGGYSCYFDGNDYISIADGTYKTLGSDPWTYECWVYPTSVASGLKYILGDHASSGSGATTSVNIWLNGANFGIFCRTSASANFNLNESTTRSANQWYHLALVFDQTNVILYVDGTAVINQSHTSGFNDGSGSFSVGRTGDYNGAYYTGYVRDVRLVKGTAVYTSTFTPPTEPLTAISGTSLLTCHLPYIADGSSNSHSITVAGNTHTQRVGPFDYGTYSKTDHLGSPLFDGIDDYINVNDSTELDFGSGDWTVEHWFYKTGSFKNYESLWAKFASNAGYWTHVNATGKLLFGTSGTNFVTSTQSLSIKTWHHIATVRHNGTIKVYLDGVATSISMSYGSNNDNNTPFLIGVINGYNRYTQGFISDFRVVKGTAVYTSDFTPPNAPLTAISGTSLLTCTNKNFLWDQSGSYAIHPWTSVTAEGFAKFANEDSIKFDGTTNSYVMIGAGYTYKPLKWLNDDELGPGTFEAWIYQTAQSNGSATNTSPCILGWGGTYFNFGVEGSQLRFYYWTGSTNTVDPSGATISLNTWHHVAFSNDSSNNLRIFLDGTLVHTISSFPGVAYASAANGEYIYLGTESQNVSSRFTGYIYNARITDGLARYTANFTSPTEPLGG